MTGLVAVSWEMHGQQM